MNYFLENEIENLTAISSHEEDDKRGVKRARKLTNFHDASIVEAKESDDTQGYEIASVKLEIVQQNDKDNEILAQKENQQQPQFIK